MQQTSENLGTNYCPVCEKMGVDISPETSSCPQCESDLRVYPLLNTLEKELKGSSPSYPSELKLYHDYSRSPFPKFFLLTVLLLSSLIGGGGTLVYLMLSKDASSKLTIQREQNDLLGQLVKMQKRLSLIENNQKSQNAELLSQFTSLNEKVLEKESVSHSFQAKDTLWEIAKYYWRDGRLYPLLLELNPHLNLHRTIPGTMLQIEMRPSVIQKLAAMMIITKGKRRFMNYLIQEGDTFQSLATRFYGTSNQASRFTGANLGMAFIPGERIVVPLPY